MELVESKKAIVLHGIFAEHLPAELNGRFEAYYTSAVDAAACIEANFPGFYELIYDKHICLVPTGSETGLTEDQITWQVTADELHIMPAIDGAGKGLGAVLGVLLVAVAAVVTGGAAIGLAGAFGGGAMAGFGAGTIGAWAAGVAVNMGIGMILNSLVQPPKAPKIGQDSEDNGIYTGPLNVFEEGAALPIVLGTIEAGGVVIHTDYDVVTIKNDDYKDDG